MGKHFLIFFPEAYSFKKEKEKAKVEALIPALMQRNKGGQLSWKVYFTPKPSGLGCRTVISSPGTYLTQESTLRETCAQLQHRGKTDAASDLAALLFTSFFPLPRTGMFPASLVPASQLHFQSSASQAGSALPPCLCKMKVGWNPGNSRNELTGLCPGRADSEAFSCKPVRRLRSSLPGFEVRKCLSIPPLPSVYLPRVDFNSMGAKADYEYLGKQGRVSSLHILPQ